MECRSWSKEPGWRGRGGATPALRSKHDVGFVLKNNTGELRKKKLKVQYTGVNHMEHERKVGNYRRRKGERHREAGDPSIP